MNCKLLTNLILSAILVAVNVKVSKSESIKLDGERLGCNFSLLKSCLYSHSLSLANYPNGEYFYGEQPKANQVGGKYLILKKEADLINGFAYIRNSGHGTSCFQGQVVDNQIVNVRIIDMDGSDNSNIYESETNIDLNSYYLLAEADTQVNTQIWLEQCIQLFND